MDIRRTIIAILILFSVADLFSQQLSHQVLLPGAGVIYKSGISYSQTIGETAVELLVSSGHYLTQGFQQPGMKFLPGTQHEGTGVRTYPNPVSDFVNVELYGESGRSITITLSNVSGIMVYTKDLTFDSKYWYIQEIPVSHLSSGLYFVQVFSKDRVLRRTFKIEKI